MSRNGLKKLAITGAVVTAIGLGGVSVAAASSGGGDTGETDTPITGPALDQAGAAALDHLGEGRVTGTEVGDEDSYYEVEVTLDDGSEVDVQLDESFTVVGSEHDVPGDD